VEDETTSDSDIGSVRANIYSAISQTTTSKAPVGIAPHRTAPAPAPAPATTSAALLLSSRLLPPSTVISGRSVFTHDRYSLFGGCTSV